MQPLIVSRVDEKRYELIAGERRLRASRLAGLSEVPVVIREVDDEKLLALSILENIQREDLNPIEESRAYQELIEQYRYSQEDVARKLGKSRVAVTNSLRLLKLPRVIQTDVSEGRYTAGHARAILGLENMHDQLKLREVILKHMPTVRDVEQMVQERSTSRRATARRNEKLTPQLVQLSDRLKQALGTKVVIRPSRNGNGKVVIDYYSVQDLDRIYQHIVTS